MFRTPATLAVLAATLVSLVALAQDWPDADTDSDDDPWGYHDPVDTGPSSWFAEDGEDEEDAAPERLRIYDDLGRNTGRAQRNPVLEQNYDLYDEYGRRTGRVDANPVVKGQYDVYDDRGRRVQQIRKTPWLDNQYDVYDDRGRRVGKIKENPLIKGQYDIYDELGRKTGKAKSE